MTQRPTPVATLPHVAGDAYLNSVWAAISLLREDFEKFKRDVSVGQILSSDEVSYWKAHTRAVETLVTELRTHKGELPGNLKELAQAVTDVPAPACNPGDHGA